jgi:proteasome lid subunit RPN8/RPN11
MIERGALSEGQVFRFKVAAYPVSDDPSDDDAGFDIDEEGEALRLGMRDIDELAANARPAGVEADESDMRTFIPASVLDATFAHAEASGDDEVGGFLLGHLERTPGSPDIFLEVTAQVPARHTDATNASLTFTSETWTAVHDAVALRGRGELIAGWWHLHPNFAKKTCAKCPEVRRRQCPMSKPFFSATDVHMHRAVFPRAYQTALLLSDLGDETFDVRFYGWRHGNVVSRGFEIVAE